MPRCHCLLFRLEPQQQQQLCGIHIFWLSMSWLGVLLNLLSCPSQAAWSVCSTFGAIRSVHCFQIPNICDCLAGAGDEQRSSGFWRVHFWFC
ncbi:hypothetical protein ACLKA7_004378 [Drosophila subpalustris]